MSPIDIGPIVGWVVGALFAGGVLWWIVSLIRSNGEKKILLEIKEASNHDLRKIANRRGRAAPSSKARRAGAADELARRERLRLQDRSAS